MTDCARLSAPRMNTRSLALSLNTKCHLCRSSIPLVARVASSVQPAPYVRYVFIDSSDQIAPRLSSTRTPLPQVDRTDLAVVRTPVRAPVKNGLRGAQNRREGRRPSLEVAPVPCTHRPHPEMSLKRGRAARCACPFWRSGCTVPL